MPSVTEGCTNPMYFEGALDDPVEQTQSDWLDDHGYDHAVTPANERRPDRSVRVLSKGACGAEPLSQCPTMCDNCDMESIQEKIRNIFAATDDPEFGTSVWHTSSMDEGADDYDPVHAALAGQDAFSNIDTDAKYEAAQSVSIYRRQRHLVAHLDRIGSVVLEYDHGGASPDDIISLIVIPHGVRHDPVSQERNRRALESRGYARCGSCKAYKSPRDLYGDAGLCSTCDARARKEARIAGRRAPGGSE